MADMPETRDRYRYFVSVATRWNDNDVYGHVNNVDYYAFFDTVINDFLIKEGGLDIHEGEVIGLCAESRCRFFAPLRFPEPVLAALRVGQLGRRSVRYELALFGAEEEPAATGWFVHVFVERASREPCEIPADLRAALGRLVPAGKQSGAAGPSERAGSERPAGRPGATGP